MPKYRGVHIDIGGPLRVSDIEMHGSEDKAFRDIYGLNLNFLEPMESWQLYGIFSKEGYVGFVKAALAILESKRSFADFMRDDNPIESLQDAINTHVDLNDDRIRETAKLAKDNYMANQSKRLADGAMEGLALLKDNGVDLSIITSVVTPDAIKWVRNNGLSEYFNDHLVMGNSPEGATQKDEKASNLVNANKIMGLEPNQTIYIADTRGDMQASMEIGCSIAMVREGMTPKELFKTYLKGMSFFEPGKNYFEFENLLGAAENIVG